ncbi:MAG: hypothetical protein GY849_21430 [Deltaproteobacteria bacterium]|nr:hypothetical protein [Deltaproteobacteria bacterium]
MFADARTQDAVIRGAGGQVLNEPILKFITLVTVESVKNESPYVSGSFIVRLH